MNHTLNSLGLLHKTMEKIDGAYAPSTIRAYRAHFERFMEFCENLKICALPADPERVANYVAHLTKSNLKSSSIRIAVASISSIHKLNSLKDPTQHPDVKIEMRRMHRTLGRHSKQAYGITEHVLENMICATSNNLRGIRDRALLLLAYESMCRRSEIVCLKISDITFGENYMKIRLRKSKTDQELHGRWIFLSKKSMEAITLWINQARISDGYLFRGINNAMDVAIDLKCNQINRIYKRIAINASLPQEIVDHISGHSMRVGRLKIYLNLAQVCP